MLVALENAKSLTYYAAWAVDQRLDERRWRYRWQRPPPPTCPARSPAPASNLRGGIGMTWEHDLQLYFKRAKASEVAFGDATWHRERVARLIP
jgi:alkylation response protein AidB-like acyl-CoA dehydrogenase